MNEIGEAIGSGAEGAAWSRAAEPDHGEASTTPAETALCRNCGADLEGPYCHHCGQKRDIHRTLSAFFHDLLHGVLHFEGKTWRTLPMLVWHPGRLTREYIDGHRARYVSPIALFLFVVFLSFATFQLLGGSKAMIEDIDVNVDAREAAEVEYARNAERLVDLRENIAEERADGDDEAVRELEAEITELEELQEALTEALKLLGSDAVEAGSPVITLDTNLDESSAWQQAKENPQLLAYKLQTNAYKFAWLLILMSVPFVWLLYCWRREFRFYDHTIFTTYSITFMIALIGISGVLIYAGQNEGWTALEPLGVLLLLYAPVHMYRQLRGTYSSSRVGSFLRMLALSLFAWIAIGLFAVALAGMA